MMVPDIIKATTDELKSWDEYKKEFNPDSIIIPYTTPVGAVNIVGVFYLRDPTETSYTDGVVVGFVNGDYHLDKNRGQSVLKGPNPQYPAFKVYVRIEFGESKMYGRICSRKWNGDWSCGGWKEIASW